jgi:hypothetical protein
MEFKDCKLPEIPYELSKLARALEKIEKESVTKKSSAPAVGQAR